MNPLRIANSAIVRDCFYIKNNGLCRAIIFYPVISKITAYYHYNYTSIGGDNIQRIMYEAAKLRKATTEMNPDVAKAITLFEYDEALLDSNNHNNGLDTAMNRLSSIITIATFIFTTITNIVRSLIK